MFDKDSIKGTMTVVIVLSLICSVIVAGSAVLLKNKQLEQKLLDKNKNVLLVANLYDTQSDVQQLFDSKIITKYVELETGDFVEKPLNYDANKFAKDAKTSIKLNSSDDLANIRTRANVVEIYLVKNDQDKVSQVILPIYGNGLWSMMYAFIAIELDGNTIEGITYYDQGETPGLGGEVENPRWRNQFKGKKIYNNNDEVAIRVAKNASSNKEFGVDALTGASLTSNGVQNTLQFWFGDKGYKKFLNNLREGTLNDNE